MWNKHLQEVTDKLITTLKELPVPKRPGVFENIKSRLAIDTLQATKKILTSHTHEWLFPLGELQRMPILTHPEQRVEQRVTPNHHANAAPLQRITEAPPIKAAPNLTAKWILKKAKRMHSQHTRNNIPDSVLAITHGPSVRRPLPAPTPSPIEAMQTSQHLGDHQGPINSQAHRCLCASHKSNFNRIPQVRFQPIAGAIRNSNLISQEAINFLTECVCLGEIS
jgi:hypothetical protein